MRLILQRLSQHIVSNEKETEKYRQFNQTKSSTGWAVMQEWLLFMRGLIAEHMLSRNFTELSATEKDTHQRAYAMVDELIRFLLDPTAEARKRMLIVAHNEQIAGSPRRRTATGKE